MTSATAKAEEAAWYEYLSRRALFSIVPAGSLGCLGCVRAMACAQPSRAEIAGRSWTEKADLTWEEMFAVSQKLRLIRTETLMQGDDSCSLRYVMEA